MSLERIVSGLFDFDPTTGISRGTEAGNSMMRVALESQRQMFDVAQNAANAQLQAERNQISKRSQMFNELTSGLNRLDKFNAQNQAAANNAAIMDGFSGSASGGIYGDGGIATYDSYPGQGDATLPSYDSAGYYGPVEETNTFQGVEADTTMFNEAEQADPNVPTEIPSLTPSVDLDSNKLATIGGDTPATVSLDESRSGSGSMFNEVGRPERWNPTPPDPRFRMSSRKKPVSEEHKDISFAEAAPKPVGTSSPAITLGAGQTPAPDTPSNQFAIDRSAFQNELKADSDLQRLLFASTAAEVGSQGPEAQTAYMESVMNRAAARGTSLRAVLSDPNYYPSVTKRKLGNPNPPDFSENLNAVLGGSNVSKFATDNASNAPGNPLARNRLKAGNPGETIGGELFYTNVNGSGSGGVREHAVWRQQQEEAFSRFGNNQEPAQQADGLPGTAVRAPDAGLFPAASMPEYQALERSKADLQKATEQKTQLVSDLTRARRSYGQAELQLSMLDKKAPNYGVEAAQLSREISNSRAKASTLESQLSEIKSQEKTLQGAVLDAQSAFNLAGDRMQVGGTSADPSSVIDTFFDSDFRERQKIRLRTAGDQELQAVFDNIERQEAERREAEPEPEQEKAPTFKIGQTEYSFEDLVELRDTEAVQAVLEKDPKLQREVMAAAGLNSDGGITIQTNSGTPAIGTGSATLESGPANPIGAGAGVSLPDGSFNGDVRASSPEAGSLFIRSIQ